jgi:transposase-like protein
MSRSTISTFQLFEMFPTPESARLYLESRLWPDGPFCPECKSRERVGKQPKVGFYRCNACSLDFTIRTGTIFERSHIPLHKWLYAMYLLVTARKGISSLQLAKEIGVTQKSAWFMLHRLREACGGPKLTKLRGIVEVDECFIGGKERNKHEHKKLKMGRGSVGKTAVLGMRERGTGRTFAATMPERSLQEATQRIHENIELGTQLYTDEHLMFTGLDGLFFKHDAVNHSAGEYAAGPAHTNGIESVWAVLKRGYYGVYHSMSGKHLRRYVDEFTFRLNEGNVKRHSLERLDSMIEAVSGKRLTYAGLTA